jgi:hypothetical protein
MSRSKIEMFLSEILPDLLHAAGDSAALFADTGCSTIAKRMICAFVILAAGGLVPPLSAARAAPPSIVLFAGRDVDDSLSQAVANLASETTWVEIGGADAACATVAGVKPRLALVSGRLSPSYIEACAHTADAQVISVALGHQAVALVAASHTPVWPISSDALFRALTEHAAKADRRASWNELESSYPKLPIGVLLAPPASAAERLFAWHVMAPPCIASADPGLPFDLGNRILYCNMLRRDLPSVQRQTTAQDLAAWAAEAPAGQIAIVRVSALGRLDGLVIPLPLDGVLPTSVNIASGRYVAAERIELLIVVPKNSDRNGRDAARTRALDLLGEASIGPGGNLVAAGLIPLTTAERVAARSQALTLLETPR